MLSAIAIQLKVNIVHLMINRTFDRRIFFLPIVSRVGKSGGCRGWLGVKHWLTAERFLYGWV